MAVCSLACAPLIPGPVSPQSPGAGFSAPWCWQECSGVVRVTPDLIPCSLDILQNLGKLRSALCR